MIRILFKTRASLLSRPDAKIMIVILLLLVASMRTSKAEDAQANGTEQLLREVKSDPTFSAQDFKLGPGGRIVSLTLRHTNVNDRALAIVAELNSVEDLCLRGSPAPGVLTARGFLMLSRATNLHSLRLGCEGPLDLGVLAQISKLRNLCCRALSAAFAPTNEYSSLTNLQALIELHLTYCTNFGDREVEVLKGLPNLRSITLDSTAISQRGRAGLAQMRHLTNVVIWPQTD